MLATTGYKVKQIRLFVRVLRLEFLVRYLAGGISKRSWYVTRILVCFVNITLNWLNCQDTILKSSTSAFYNVSTRH